MSATSSSDDLAYVTSLVREHDRPRYYATLFAPASARPDLFALYGFAAEVARVPDQVSDPPLGEIRLRWWQDSLTEATAPGGAGSTPALRAVADTISRRRLPLAAFTAMIEARSADLYSDPPPTVAELEGYLGETESALFQMAAIALGAEGPETAVAAGHAGIAYGLARRLASFASERARGRSLIPAEIRERHGIASAALLAEQPPTRLGPVLAEVTVLSSRHLEMARDAIGTIRPGGVRTAFLPLAGVGPILRAVQRAGESIVQKDLSPADLSVLLRTALARFRM